MASFEETAEAVARAFDRACSAAVGLAGWEGAYVSPLWEVEVEGSPSEVRGWKRSVLRRVPGAGAEPWGHLFLVVTASPSAAVRLESLGTGTAAPGRGGTPTPLDPPLWRGPPRAQLFVRPRSEATSGSLRAFAEALRAEFVPPAGVAQSQE